MATTCASAALDLRYAARPMLAPVRQHPGAGHWWPSGASHPISPLLALVAPTGMDRDARRVWFNAAVRALEGIPILLLKRGVEAAIAKADHPSKIVPTILGSVKEDWEWRRNYRAPKPVQAWEPSSRVPEGERREVAAMFDELLGRLGRDSDRSPEGGDGEAGSVADESAGPQDIAKDQAA